MYVKEDSDEEITYEEFYANHVKEITKIILKKLEAYADSSRIEGILTSVYTEDNPQNTHEIHKNITQIKSRN